MSVQSSRIIWGKTKKGEVSDYPVTVYDPDYTIYTYDNECIYQDKLYKCIVAETGGENFTASEWKEIKGVAPFATTKSYKVNAYCIYNNYLYKCIQAVTYTSYDPVIKYPDQYPNYWEQTLQPVNVAYSPRDHKDVYYDNGRNSIKWHKMMYYLPPELEGNEDLPVTIYDEAGNYVYKKDDLCIHENLSNEMHLYKCKADIPIHENWNIGHWTELETPVFSVGTSYAKGDEVIYNFSEVKSEIVSVFNTNVNYISGQMLLDEIKTSEILVDMFDQDYIDRIEGGERIYGCYILNRDIPAGSSTYFDHDWGALTNYKQYDGKSGPTTIGEYFIRYDDIWVLTKVESGSGGQPFKYTDVEELHSYKQGWYLFRSFEDQLATHFNRDKWIIITQKYDIIYDELYGVIWQKLGNPGSAGRPFYYPYALAFPHDSYPHLNIHTRLGSFFPYLGDNKLEPNETVMMFGYWNNTEQRYICSTYDCGDLIVSNKLQTLCYMHDYYIKAVLSLVKFTNNWSILELSREADPRYGIIPINSGFLYVAYDKQDPGFYDIYKATLSTDSSEILNETFEFTVPVSMPSIDGEIGGLNSIQRYNGLFESEMWYQDVYYLPTDSDFGAPDHSTGPRQYRYLAIIFEDGSVQCNQKDPSAADNVAMASIRSASRYLLNDLITDAGVGTGTTVYSALADRSEVQYACTYWGFTLTENPDTHALTSTYPYLKIEFSGSSYWIEWKICNKEGSNHYRIINYYLIYTNNVDERKRFICTVLIRLNRYGSNQTITVFKGTYDVNDPVYAENDLIFPYHLYNQDDGFIYFATANYRLGQINLQTGEYILNAQLSNYYLIKNIPYYNNDTFHAFRSSTYYDIKRAHIRLVTGDEDDDHSNSIRTVYNEEDGSIDILWGVGQARRAFMNAYCDSNSGSPVLGHGIFITGETAITNLSGVYNIALYIPNFKSNPSNEGAFFWFSSLGWYGHPCYGGEDEDGFEGW
jgi:hypothetical protein